MDIQNTQSRIITAMETMEGAGVTVNRTIGSPALRSLKTKEVNKNDRQMESR